MATDVRRPQPAQQVPNSAGNGGAVLIGVVVMRSPRRCPLGWWRAPGCAHALVPWVSGASSLAGAHRQLVGSAW
ncbi:MAG: hypothetical protein IPH03_13650 [Tetrasphaera sp.]|nr:hypothetical protein [Tetrasphaera sp.]